MKKGKRAPKHKKYIKKKNYERKALEMALTCCLWHAFDIWQIAHTEDEGAFRMKWLNYVQSGGNWKTGKTVKLKVRFPGRMEICAATRASTFNCHNWQAKGRGFACGIGNIGGIATPKILPWGCIWCVFQFLICRPPSGTWGPWLMATLFWSSLIDRPQQPPNHHPRPSHRNRTHHPAERLCLSCIFTH